MLVGLAVGVDYAMFYLRREMEEQDKGRSSEDALQIAAATSGRAVLISGLTVMAAMGGMFFSGNPIFVSFGIGTILVVGVAISAPSRSCPPCSPSSAARAGWRRAACRCVAKRRHRNRASPASGARSSTASSSARWSRRSLAGGLLVALTSRRWA